MNETEALKQKILDLSKEYSKKVHSKSLSGQDNRKEEWKQGETIPYAGRVFSEDEIVAAINTTLDFWLTLGSEGEMFEMELASFLGVKESLLVNSGSSANLIALSTLTSHKIDKKKRLLEGDEVITVAAGFPTTVAPIAQVGAIPVFIDADPITGNPKCNELEKAYKPGKTKVVMFAHALGNPFELSKVLLFCQKYNLWLIEDNCDSLGSSYSMPKELAYKLGFKTNSPGLNEGEERIVRWTGAWGDMSTQSFYPPHHITMGEGGAINFVRDSRIRKIAESFRDWGRDCWCKSGVDNSCRKRYEWKTGALPVGYDHKYTYSHLGYNLKPLEVQAAIGRIQLKKLPDFIKDRKSNWERLRNGLQHCSDILEFSLPTHATSWHENNGIKWDNTGCRSDCSWFGFKIAIRAGLNVSRPELIEELSANSIASRMLFGGNLVKQPAFIELLKRNPNAFRTVGKLEGSDYIMRNVLFLGTYPGLTEKMIDYEIEIISNFCQSVRKNTP